MAALGKLKRALSTFAASVRADHAHLHELQHKYGAHGVEDASIGREAVEKIGFQVVVAYRLMRLFVDLDANLAARVASRAIRHLYGSDIHWDARLAPGVSIVHGMGMAISNAASVGRGALLFQHCTLGEGRHPDTHEVGAPTLEEHVVVGAGATILGPVTIGARTKIMPGCVVLRSVPADSIVESPPAVARARRRGMREAGE